MARNVRAQVRQAVIKVKIPKQSEQRVVAVLTRAIRYADYYRQQPHLLYTLAGAVDPAPKISPPSSGGHPPEAPLRNLVISALFQAWAIAYGTKAKIPNRGYPDNQFYILAESIFVIARMGQVRKHLEAYQTYRKASLKNFHATGF